MAEIEGFGLPQQPNDVQSYGRQFQLFNRTIHAQVTKSHQFVDGWLQPLIDIVDVFEDHVGMPFIVGFGVEIVDGAVATLQLCYDDKCLIYHMSGEESFPVTLLQLLFHPKCAFMGFGLEEPQLDILTRDARFHDNMDYWCLGDFAEKYVHEDLSLLATVVLKNLDVVRPQPGGRWDLEVLSDKQIEYASIGAYVFHQIGKLLWRAKTGRPPRMFEFKRNEVEDAIEQVHEVQIFNKTIITTVTNRLIAVENWIASVIRDRHLYDYVGFDVQNYISVNRSHIATVQFCVDTRCLIIQYDQMNGRYLPNLEHFLVRGNNTFVGINIQWKMWLLKQTLFFENGGPLKVIDLGANAATTRGRPDLRFARPDTIARELFGTNFERPPDVENDWYRPLLTDVQVQCACIDAAASYEIRKRLLSGP